MSATCPKCKAVLQPNGQCPIHGNIAAAPGSPPQLAPQPAPPQPAATPSYPAPPATAPHPAPAPLPPPPPAMLAATHRFKATIERTAAKARLHKCADEKSLDALLNAKLERKHIPVCCCSIGGHDFWIPGAAAFEENGGHRMLIALCGGLDFGDASALPPDFAEDDVVPISRLSKEIYELLRRELTRAEISNAGRATLNETTCSITTVHLPVWIAKTRGEAMPVACLNAHSGAAIFNDALPADHSTRNLAAIIGAAGAFALLLAVIRGFKGDFEIWRSIALYAVIANATAGLAALFKRLAVFLLKTLRDSATPQKIPAGLEQWKSVKTGIAAGFAAVIFALAFGAGVWASAPVIEKRAQVAASLEAQAQSLISEASAFIDNETSKTNIDFWQNDLPKNPSELGKPADKSATEWDACHKKFNCIRDELDALLAQNAAFKQDAEKIISGNPLKSGLNDLNEKLEKQRKTIRDLRDLRDRADNAAKWSGAATALCQTPSAIAAAEGICAKMKFSIMDFKSLGAADTKKPGEWLVIKENHGTASAALASEADKLNALAAQLAPDASSPLKSEVEKARGELVKLAAQMNDLKLKADAAASQANSNHLARKVYDDAEALIRDLPGSTQGFNQQAADIAARIADQEKFAPADGHTAEQWKIVADSFAKLAAEASSRQKQADEALRKIADNKKDNRNTGQTGKLDGLSVELKKTSALAASLFARAQTGQQLAADCAAIMPLCGEITLFINYVNGMTTQNNAKAARIAGLQTLTETFKQIRAQAAANPADARTAFAAAERKFNDAQAALNQLKEPEKALGNWVKDAVVNTADFEKKLGEQAAARLGKVIAHPKAKAHLDAHKARLDALLAVYSTRERQSALFNIQNSANQLADASNEAAALKAAEEAMKLARTRLN
jgi:hypothetical protein